MAGGAAINQRLTPVCSSVSGAATRRADSARKESCAVLLRGRAALGPTGSSLRVAQRVRTDEIVRAERNEKGDWCCNRVVEEQRGTHGCGVRRNSRGTARNGALAPPPGTSGTNRKAAPGRWMLNTGLYQY